MASVRGKRSAIRVLFDRKRSIKLAVARLPSTSANRCERTNATIRGLRYPQNPAYISDFPPRPPPLNVEGKVLSPKSHEVTPKFAKEALDGLFPLYGLIPTFFPHPPLGISISQARGELNVRMKLNFRRLRGTSASSSFLRKRS